MDTASILLLILAGVSLPAFGFSFYVIDLCDRKAEARRLKKETGL
jgi:hypothetical protein